MAPLALPIGQRDHLRGPAEAPVVLLEYGDFECPHCREAHEVLRELEDDIEAYFRLAFRHFPLSAIHPNAEAAAQAAEAAGVQGKFWEMHDVLFRHQDALEDEDLRAYAEGLDLNLEDFDEALRTGRFLPRIKEDFMSGVRSGVNGTPTFFLNGTRHDASADYPTLARAIVRAARSATTR